MKPQARKCHVCGKPKGNTAFRYIDEDGKWARDYFHPACFNRFQATWAKRSTALKRG